MGGRADRKQVVRIIRESAVEALAAHQTALTERQWDDGLRHLATSLQWRAVALAIELDIASPMVLTANDGFLSLIEEVQRGCWRVLRETPDTDDPDSRWAKASYISDVLLGIVSFAGIGLDAGLTGDDRAHLVLFNALALGRHDTTLAMAEEGHWDTVALIMRRRRKGGETTATFNRKVAEAWKQEALALAKKLDRSGLTRNGLATAIKAEAGNRVQSIRAIEEWLRTEAEAPNGPIRSRARTQHG